MVPDYSSTIRARVATRIVLSSLSPRLSRSPKRLGSASLLGKEVTGIRDKKGRRSDFGEPRAVRVSPLRVESARGDSCSHLWRNERRIVSRSVETLLPEFLSGSEQRRSNVGHVSRGTCREYFGTRYSRNDSRMNRGTCCSTFD